MVDGPPAPVAAGCRLLGGAQARWTGRAEGDLAEDGPVGEGRRRAVVDLPWTVLRQVHGAEVVTVTEPGWSWRAPADGAAPAVPGAALAVLTADCAPVALASETGVIGVAHAGWRGLAAGVINSTVAAMRALGAGPIAAVLGPCIRTRCYEFGAEDLDAVVSATGPEVRGVDAAGRPALDLAAGVLAALERAGVTSIEDVGTCTACSSEHFSHRVRGDVARQAMVVWRP
jgi:YfiH family protein